MSDQRGGTGQPLQPPSDDATEVQAAVQQQNQEDIQHTESVPSSGDNMHPMGLMQQGYRHQYPAVGVQYPQYQQYQPRVAIRPVASVPIEGTDWQEVKTNIGSMFWYNQKTGESTWVRPQEVPITKKAQPKKKALDPRKLEMLRRAKASGAVLAPEYEEMLKERERSIDGQGTVKKKKKKSHDINESKVVQEIKQDAFEEDVGYDVTFTEDDIQEKHQEYSAIHEGRAKDISTIREEYKSLLEEIGIHAFSRYERELPKLERDPRFLAVDFKERRQIFDAYCSKVGVQKSKPTNVKQRQDMKAHTEERRDGQKKRPAYEMEGMDREQRAPSSKGDIDAFKALLQEKVLNSDAKWVDIEGVLRKDDRFHGVQRWEQMDTFKDHIKKLQKVEHARRVGGRRMEQNLWKAEHRKHELERAEALENYRTLLAEMIRQPEVTWDEAQQVLEADPLHRARHDLVDDSTAQGLFEEHVQQLHHNALERLFLLFKKNAVPAELSWDDVKTSLDQEDIGFMEFSEKLKEEAWAQFKENLKTQLL